VWPEPGKEPFVVVDGGILVAGHHHPTVRTAIRALPQGHGLKLFAAVAHLRRIALIDDMQFFP